MMKVSIIMPFYNCEEYLKDSVESILNQSFDDFEFIIINDASTDNSDEIIKKYIEIDKRIVYIKNKKNIGIVNNLNKGLEIAQGKYIARMDGDDISALDRLEKQISFLEENKNIDIIGGFAHIIDEKNNVTGTLEKPIESNDIRSNLFLFLTIIHASAVIKKEVYDKIGGYNEDYLYTEDNEWTYRAIYGNNFVGANIPDIIYKYRKHSQSSSKNSKIIAKRNLKLRRKTIKEYKLQIGLKNYIGMYAHYILGTFFSSKQREKIEKQIKKIII